MKRWTFRILLCLFLGVVTTIAVAWGCLALKPLPDLQAKSTIAVFTHDTERHMWWIGKAERGLGWHIYSLFPDSTWVGAGRIVPEQLPTWVIGEELNLANRPIVSAVGCGWPLVCMSARQTGNDDTENAIARTGVVRSGLGPQAVLWGSWESAIQLNSDQPGFIRRPSVLPYHVELYGFAVNVILFSALWMLTFTIRPLQRAMRRRHGRCIKCRYDLRGTSRGTSGRKMCPECGTLTSKEKSTTGYKNLV